jgi:hypothetical protein
MAKGKKTGGKDFVPGDPRMGRKRVPEELKGMRALSKAEATAALSDVLKLTTQELDELLESKTATMMQLCAARIVKVAFEQGDQQRLNFMLDRLIGRVKDELDVKVSIQPKVMILPTLGQTINVEFEDKPTEELEEAKE